MDEHSVLDRLLNELELDSAVQRLQRIGFGIIVSASNQYHLRRNNKNIMDDIYITLNEKKQLVVQFARNMLFSSKIEVITTWDEWICFVRMLFTQSSIRRRIALSEDQVVDSLA